MKDAHTATRNSWRKCRSDGRANFRVIFAESAWNDIGEIVGY